MTQMGSDPWRYECPNCGSQAIEWLVSGERWHGKSYRADGAGRQRAERDAAKRWLCKACCERSSRVLDLKTGELVRRVSDS